MCIEGPWFFVKARHPLWNDALGGYEVGWNSWTLAKKSLATLPAQFWLPYFLNDMRSHTATKIFPWRLKILVRDAFEILNANLLVSPLASHTVAVPFHLWFWKPALPSSKFQICSLIRNNNTTMVATSAATKPCHPFPCTKQHWGIVSPNGKNLSRRLTRWMRLAVRKMWKLLMLKHKQGFPTKDRPPSATDGRVSVWHADHVTGQESHLRSTHSVIVISRTSARRSVHNQG